jgi:hypothetical protein
MLENKTNLCPIFVNGACRYPGTFDSCSLIARDQSKKVRIQKKMINVVSLGLVLNLILTKEKKALFDLNMSIELILMNGSNMELFIETIIWKVINYISCRSHYIFIIQSTKISSTEPKISLEEYQKNLPLKKNSFSALGDLSS